jgi:hypothetical protein
MRETPRGTEARSARGRAARAEDGKLEPPPHQGHVTKRERPSHSGLPTVSGGDYATTLDQRSDSVANVCDQASHERPAWG